MNIKKNYEVTNILSFVHSVMGNKIYNDPSIQRRRNWDKNNKIGYRNSILSNTDTDNLVLCNIKDSMDNSLSTQNKMDYEYFSQLYNEGYRYISIDGGNRTDFLLNEYQKNYNNYVPVSDDAEEFFNSKINVVYLSNCTKEQLHLSFLNKNSGNSANAQERRNATPGYVSDFIRKVGGKYSGPLSVIEAIDFSRMKDLEFMSYLLQYHQSKTTSLNSNSLDVLYRQSELHNEKEFLNILNQWAMCITLTKMTKSKIYKTYAMNLFMFILEMSREHKCVLNKDVIPLFVDKFLELDNKRTIDTIHNEPETNWSDLRRGIGKKLTYKFDYIYNDFLPFIDDYFYILDDKRLFTEFEKINKHIENGCLVTKMDGSVVYVTILQMLNGEHYHGGHKDKPHTKGGKTNPDNLEIQDASENISQSNRH